MATRQIILDTETTGLEPRLGHRIIEVAGVAPRVMARNTLDELKVDDSVKGGRTLNGLPLSRLNALGVSS